MSADRLQFIDADGGTHELVDAACQPANMSGRWMPPAELTLDDLPVAGGAALRYVRFGARRIITPVLFEGATWTAMRAATEAFLVAADPTRGPGTLLQTHEDGSQREIDALYETGLQIDEGLGSTFGPPGLSVRSPGVQRTVVTWVALDPFWRDTDDDSFSFTGANPGLFFPIFPLVLTDLAVFDTDTVINVGDVEAWPVWTIIGPTDRINLANETTGRTLSLTTSLDPGDTLTIDTRPGVGTIVDQNGDSHFGEISGTRDLWPLVPGSNTLRVEMGSYDPGTSGASLVWRPRYFGP